MPAHHAARPGIAVVHGDRGSKFRSQAFVRALRRHGLAGSMRRVGACADNAAMEWFLQPRAEEPQPPLLTTREGLRPALVVWIEKTYQRRRRQQALPR